MFDKFKKNVFSQFGEDGIIEELIKRLEIKNLEVCEFGAWDGKLYSNTFNLVKNFNAKAVYIEGNKDRFSDLKRTCLDYKNIIPINVNIEIDPNSTKSLKNVLKSTSLNKKFDVLSIDIDSYDLEIWENFEDYDPKIVVIEINSYYKPGVFKRHESKNPGCSFSSALEVANNKNYTIISHTGNCIFVKNEYIEKIKFDEKFIKNPSLLFNSRWIYGPFKKLKLFLIKKILNRTRFSKYND